jgi:hypothetical protein
MLCNLLLLLTFCQVCLLVKKRLQRLKQEWQKSPGGTRLTYGKNYVWFREIERKLAKLSKTTFTYRSSSQGLREEMGGNVDLAWVREAELLQVSTAGMPYLVAVPITDDMSEVRRCFR